MSSATAVRNVRVRTTSPPSPVRTGRTGLRLVTTPERLRSRAGLATASALALSAGLVVLLVLAVSVQRGAYQMRQLRADTAELVERRQALAEELATLQAPQALAAQARALGMVPAPNLAVIRRSDGAVLGEGTPAPRPPAPRPAPRTPAHTAPAATAGTAKTADPKPVSQSKADPAADPKPATTTQPAAPAARTPAAAPAAQPSGTAG